MIISLTVDCRIHGACNDVIVRVALQQFDSLN